jgi:hypothetical protein
LVSFSAKWEERKKQKNFLRTENVKKNEKKIGKRGEHHGNNWMGNI